MSIRLETQYQTDRRTELAKQYRALHALHVIDWTRLALTRKASQLSHDN